MYVTLEPILRSLNGQSMSWPMYGAVGSLSHVRGTQATASSGLHSFCTVQLALQYGHSPVSNMYPFGHLYLFRSYSYQLHPPSGASGGDLGHGSASHSSRVVMDHFLVGRQVETLGRYSVIL